MNETFFKIPRLIIMLASMILFGCGSGFEDSNMKKISLPQPISDSVFQAVVVTPLGEYQTLEYDPITQLIDTLKLNGSVLISSLPSVVNEAFIPIPKGEKNGLVPVWIAAMRLQPGQILGVKPIGMIEYTDQGINQREVLLVPVDDSERSIGSDSFKDFIIMDQSTKFQFEYWLRNRHELGSVSQIIWKDELQAKRYLLDLLKN